MIGMGLDSKTYKIVSLKNFANIARRILVKLLVIAKYDDCDINGAQNGELMSFFEQSTFALQESSKVTARLAMVDDSGCIPTYTDLFRSSLIALISIFLLPMVIAT